MINFIKALDQSLEYEKHEVCDDMIFIYVHSMLKSARCPYCGFWSQRCHSRYKREFQDVPFIKGKSTIIILNNRKMFCDNPDCKQITFAETGSFIERKSKKTARLIQEILDVSKNKSLFEAEKNLRGKHIKVGKSTIHEILKKG